MCGRYASTRRPEQLIEEFEISADRTSAPLAADYNVAPTKPVYAVVERPPSGRRHDAESRDSESSDAEKDAEKDAEGRRDPDAPAQRQLRELTWGLIPSWAKDPKIGNRMINARMETLAEKPSFRRAFAARRCLLPADGYFEWYPTERKTKAGKPAKQPFFIRPKDHGVLAMAGLYEIWRDPDRAEDDPDRFRWTCTVITTSAEDEVGHIHDRMPLMVEPDRWGEWLDPSPRDKADLLSLLVPAAPGRLEAYPVSTAVGNVRNNGPELIEPLAAEA